MNMRLCIELPIANCQLPISEQDHFLQHVYRFHLLELSTASISSCFFFSHRALIRCFIAQTDAGNQPTSMHCKTRQASPGTNFLLTKKYNQGKTMARKASVIPESFSKEVPGPVGIVSSWFIGIVFKIQSNLQSDLGRGIDT